MKRLVPSAVALLLGLSGVMVSPGVASAAPLPATYSGSAGGDVVALDLEVPGGVNFVGARLASTSSDVDSSGTPRASAAASNLAAVVAGLRLAVETDRQTAPPNNGGPETDTIAAASVMGVLDLGALSTSVEAHYTTDAACVPGNLLSDSRVQTAGVQVEPPAVGQVVSTGVSSTRGVVDLVPSPADDPSNRAVRSRAFGTIADASFLDGAVQVAIGDSSLTAIATGEAGGAEVAYDPGKVTVTVGGDTVTLEVGASQEFTVGTSSVTITVNDPTITEAANGRTASGSVSVVTAEVRVGAASNALATATVDLLPLRALAEAPDGGIDCPAAAPVLTTPEDGSSTTDTTPTFTGTAVPEATVEIFVDGDSIGSTTADEDGDFSFTPTDALDLGEYDATAVATVGGADSAPSNTNTFSVIPAAPVLTTPADGSSTIDTTPTFTGTTLPNAAVEIFVDGDSIGTTTANGDGVFSFTPTTALAPGEYDATAVATVDGADSAPSNTNTFTVTTNPPPAPVLTTPADGSSTTDTTPTFGGTTLPGAAVEIFVDGDSIGTDTADGDGVFSFTPTTPLAPGTFDATVVATVDGVDSAPSEDNTFEVTPAAPVLATPADGSSTSDTTPTFTGTAVPEATVEIFVDGDSIGTTTADGDGDFTFTPVTPLPPGTFDATAVATVDGADSDPSEANTFEVTPAAPVLITPADGSSTIDTTPIFTGTTLPNATVEIFVDGDSIGTTTANGGGAFSFTPTTALAPGEYDATVVATVDGADSAPSNTNTFTLTTDPPPAPVLATPADGSSTSDTTPTFTGTTLPGAAVEIFVDGDSIGTTTADGDGDFTFTPVTPLIDGDYVATAVATVEDADSDPSDPNTFEVDTQQPVAPAVTSPANGDTIDDTTPVITGTGEPGATVTVSIDGDVIGTAVVDEDGNFSVAVTDPLRPGLRVLRLSQTDAAGNTSPATDVTFNVADGAGDGSGGGGGSDGGGGSAGGTSDSLASTGGPVGWPLVAGLLGLISGAALLRSRRRNSVSS